MVAIPALCIWNIGDKLLKISLSQICCDAPLFVLHQYLWHIDIKPEVRSWNIWMNRHSSNCSPLVEKLMWDSTSMYPDLGLRFWSGLILLGLVKIIKGHNSWLNTLSRRQNGRHFAKIFKWIFLNQNVIIFINISLKFVPINNIPALA